MTPADLWYHACFPRYRHLTLFVTEQEQEQEQQELGILGVGFIFSQYEKLMLFVFVFGQTSEHQVALVWAAKTWKTRGFEADIHETPFLSQTIQPMSKNQIIHYEDASCDSLLIWPCPIAHTRSPHSRTRAFVLGTWRQETAAAA